MTQAIAVMKSRGTTFVINTHRTSVLSVSDRVLVLKDGSQQLFGPTAEVLQKLMPAAAASVSAQSA